jgi:predicted nucleic acid-binding protein
MAWLAKRDPLDLFVSVVTLAEIEEGIARLGRTRRRVVLEAWRDALVPSLDGLIIDLDADIARAWGALRAQLAAANRTISPMDGFIAATAECRRLTLATRNEKHFHA